MPREFSRQQRIADYLKRELATLIQMEIRDPRVGMVSVNDAEVSRDLSHAKVFVTVMDKTSAEEAEETIAVLNKAAGFLRTQIAKSTQMRTTPRLRFYFDSSVLRGTHLSALINEAVTQDALHQDADEEDDGQQD